MEKITMRICIYNPQAISGVFGKSLISILTDPSQVSASHTSKYSYLLDFIRSDKYKRAWVVDGTASSLWQPSVNVKLLPKAWMVKIFSYLEIYIWLLINGFNPLKEEIIYNVKGLKTKNDVLIGFAFLTNTFYEEKLIIKSVFSKFKGKKLVHLSHCYMDTNEVAKNVAKIGGTKAILEVDLRNSPFLKKEFKFINDCYILPFGVRDRYRKIKTFKKRSEKCLAIGSLTLFPNKGTYRYFYNYFKVDTLHPMRKKLLENAQRLKDLFDITISVHKSENKVFYKKWFIYKLIEFLITRPGQEYHQFDIVKKYNEYRMFVSPEEIHGLPSVNGVEGMACGCALIALKHQMYTDIGMVDGKHYIGYNGTFDDLQKKVLYYRKHADKLKIISNSGYKLINEKFRTRAVVKVFFEDIERYLNTGKLKSSYMVSR